MPQQDFKKIDDNTLEITTTETKVEQVDIGKVIRDRTALAERIDAQIAELQAYDEQIAQAQKAGIAIIVDVSALPSFTKVDAGSVSATVVKP